MMGSYERRVLNKMLLKDNEKQKSKALTMYYMTPSIFEAKNRAKVKDLISLRT